MNKYLSPDDQVDQLVDTEQLSYSEAARRIGMVLTEAAEVTANSIERRNAAATARAAAHAENTDLYNLTGPVVLSAEQIQRNQLGAAAARASIEKST